MSEEALMVHALVRDGLVVRVGSLPQSWRVDGRTIVGWPLADPAQHRAAGWLPLVDERPALGPGQHWGPAVHVVDVDAGEVTVTAEVVTPGPEPDVDALADTARTAVSGLDPEDPTRVAVCALADAISPTPPQEDPPS